MKAALPSALFAALAAFAQFVPQAGPPPYKPTVDEVATVRSKMAELDSRIKKLAGKADRDLLADVAICHKAAEWILRHADEFYTQVYYGNTLKALDLGLARAAELEGGGASWTAKKGRLVRAYWSEVDGSVQPYGLAIPEGYSGAPIRLDVVLHGRAARMNEVSFIAANEFDKPAPIPPDRIELHIYGRTNNAYRWAGETDVFEALASVEKRYKIDASRIVLRGFSMGGAGTWHIGLHYPDRWAAIESGAGFSETLRYAKQEAAPAYQKRAWPIYDSYLYARNAMLVPTVGYGSIDDPQLQASVNVKEQLAKEDVAPKDLRTLFLVGPKIGHRFAPESKRESEQFIQSALAAGHKEPDHIRFLTYTTRYGKCYWLAIDGLERQYERGEVDAWRDGGSIRVSTKGVSRLILPTGSKVEIDGQSVAGGVVEKRDGKWHAGSSKGLHKRQGLQGPIDDAFVGSFLCVRPTGKALDATAHGAAMERLATFQKDWARFFRGDVRVKDDSAVTAEDIRNHNLILFGDAGSNKWIAKVLPKIPVKRKPQGGEVLAVIYPNPLNPSRYVVLNSGHTFNEQHLAGTNALLFPRIGDWAILDAKGTAVEAGFFDESWR